jgi:3-phosphoshikimate 1-carboxyvinyltransferase
MIAVERAGPILGEVSVPGDKSISHRAIILASIAQGISLIKNVCPGSDVASSIRCMQMLGAKIDEVPGELVIHGTGRRGLTEAVDVLDCGNSGTTARLLMGLAAGYPFCTVFTGDDSLRERPMGRIKRPLAEMGARVEGRKGGERLPLSVRGGSLKEIVYEMPVASAQVKSAILLAGLSVQGRTSVVEKKSTRDHTERLLAAMGVRIKSVDGCVNMDGGEKLSPIELTVPGDLSSAAYLIALAVMIPGSSLLIKNVGLNPSRTGFLTILERMGASIVIHEREFHGPEPVGDIEVMHSPLRGITISGDEVTSAIDELPLLAVMATQAHGRTSISGAYELRVKETDRISAITEGLRNLGAHIEEEEDGLSLDGPFDLHGADCRSQGDHRIAMSLVVAGLVSNGRTTVSGPECVDISFPGFMELLEEVISP